MPSKLTKSQAKQRVQDLRKLINDYRYQYHVLDKSTMSEAAADSLKHELTQLEEKFPDLITPDSPTQRVAGEALDKFEKVRHSRLMLSLNDVFNREELEAWITRTDKLAPGRQHEFFADIKMDGLACALVYENGELKQAVTRGDGKIGEDVTANVHTIDSVPVRLRKAKGFEKFLRGRTEIRGEIVIFKDDFAKLNKEREAEGKPLFANPRNTAAGAIRQLDPRLAAKRRLNFRGYDIVRANAADVPTNQFTYEALQNLGIAVSRDAALLKNADEIMKFADEWDEKREKLPFNTDGLVIKLNDRAQFDALGVVGKTPRAAVAYKYAAEEATTIVKNIVISIGRTGAATPVAVFDPVVIAGTTVQHASLHNADEIARKDVRVGDTVIIFKAGDIIPQVQKVLTELRPKNTRKFDMEHELARQFPDMEFVRPEGEAVYRMKGATGSLMLKRALSHYASRGALDIDTLGEKNAAALVDAGLVSDIADIYALTQEQVQKLDRFAEISSKNLISAIAAKKEPELSRFIYGLGIRHVGQQTAIDLANHFKRLDSLGTADLETLRSVNGIGDIVADAIVIWFDEEENQQLLAKFKKLGVWPQDAKPATGKLSGKKFVITGTLETMGRDLAAEKIRKLGGTFQSSLGKDTDYLVVGANIGASKLKKAEQYETRQIKESELLKFIA